MKRVQVSMLFVWSLALVTGLQAQDNACHRVTSCGSYSQWYATCDPPLPPGAHNCDGFDFTEYCEVPTNECKTSPCDNCTTVGLPVNVATGNTSVKQTDIAIPGIGGGLKLIRTWNSKPGPTSYGMFGRHWSTNFEEEMLVGDDYLIKHSRGDGSQSTYGFSMNWGATGGTPTYLPASTLNGGDVLVYNGYLQGTPSWTLKLKNGETRVFGLAPHEVVGDLSTPIPTYLSSITDRNGNSTVISRDPNSGLVIAAADAAGRHLYFSYGTAPDGAGDTIPVVTSLTTDFGVSLSYQYDSSANLVKVTKPDSSFETFEYNPAGLLTAVKDSDGKLLESHTYDTSSRGLSSSRAGGVDSVGLSY
jgi:YD repeat-containing protein